MNFESPFFGIGLNYLNEFYEPLKKAAGGLIRWLEIRPENFLDRSGLGLKHLDEMHELYPFTTHSVSLSLGSPDPLNWDLIKKLKRFIKKYKIPYHSDHLATYSFQNTSYQMLLPVPATDKVAKYMALRAKTIQDYLEVPLALENISYTNTPLKPELTEVDFISLFLEKSQCSLLWDVSDTLIHCFNHQTKPLSVLNRFKKLTVPEIHVGGFHQTQAGYFEGTHGEPINTEVFEFLKIYAEHQKLSPILLEWEVNLPDFKVILENVKKLNDLWQESHKKSINEAA